MTPEQCRAARDLLGWTQQKLAVRAFVQHHTIKRLEDGLPGNAATHAAVEKAFSSAGVEFTNGEPRMVRLPEPLHP